MIEHLEDHNAELMGGKLDGLWFTAIGFPPYWRIALPPTTVPPRDLAPQTEFLLYRRAARKHAGRRVYELEMRP